MRDPHLRDLIAVVEAGSVRGGARRLGISESAVSKNLTALERDLGVKLVLRSSRGVEPTRQGKLVLRHARVIQNELRQLEEELAEDRGLDATQCVHVGLSSTAEALLMPRAIARFRSAAPNNEVSILSGSPATMFEALREARLDFVVSAVPPRLAGADVRVERLISADIAVVARAGHPLAHVSDMADLQGCEWIAGVRHSSALRQAFEVRGLAAPFQPIQRDSFNTLLHLLLNSDMLAIATSPTVVPLQQAGLLTVLPVNLDLPTMVQHLVTLGARPLARHAKALADEFRRASRAHRR